MITLIEMILGSKVGRVIAEILIVLALLAAATLYLEHRGATQELAKLKDSSTKLLAKANKAIATETTQHAADNAENQEKFDAALKVNAQLSDTLDQRVREFDAYRASHPDVARPAGGSGPAEPGECGSHSCGDLAVLLANTGDELARVNGELSAALQACQRDRDSIVGWPK
jgi:hypothetical protein